MFIYTIESEGRKIDVNSLKLISQLTGKSMSSVYKLATNTHRKTPPDDDIKITRRIILTPYLIKKMNNEKTK